MNGYFAELRTEWRALLSAILGLSVGLMMVSFVLGMIGPSLVAEFNWTKSQMAMVGAFAIGSIFVLPVVGRLTDVTGVKRMASIGVVSTPVLFLALTRVTTIEQYAILYFFIAAILVTTTPAVYCRTVVQYFVRARGLALGIAMAGPSAAVALGGPLINNFIADYGWRAGCMLTAAVATVGGIAALILMPPERRGAVPQTEKIGRTKHDYRQVLTSSAFWIIFIGVILSTMPNSIMMSQLNLILTENGALGKDASIMISAYATGTIFGRLISGAALDRFSAPIVAAIGLAASGTGILLLASGFDSTSVVFLAILTVGLSVGAEGDVIAYLVVRNFGVRLYSTVHSITSTGTAIASVLGAVLLSVTLKQYGIYAIFLTVCGILSVVASILFLFLPRNPQVEDELPASPPSDLKTASLEREALDTGVAA